MNDPPYIVVAKNDLERIKDICSLIPEDNTLGEISQSYKNEIINFIDHLLPIVTIGNQVDMRLLFQLCQVGSYDGCDSTILGDKRLFGHMIHFLQDIFLFTEILPIPEYQGLIDNLKDYLLYDRSPIMETLIKRLDDLRSQRRNEKKLLKQENNIAMNSGQIVTPTSNPRSEKIAQLDTDIKNKKNQIKAEENFLITPRNEVRRMFGRRRSYQKFRDAVNSKLLDLIREGEKNKLLEIKVMMNRIIFMRTIDNECKDRLTTLSAEEQLKNRLEHLVFLNIIEGFISYIDRFGHRVMNT